MITLDKLNKIMSMKKHLMISYVTLMKCNSSRKDIEQPKQKKKKTLPLFSTSCEVFKGSLNCPIGARLSLAIADAQESAQTQKVL